MTEPAELPPQRLEHAMHCARRVHALYIAAVAAWLVCGCGSPMSLTDADAATAGDARADTRPVSDAGFDAGSCPAGSSACPTSGGRACAALDRDPSNCGSCGHRCAAAESCGAGVCLGACPAGQSSCAGGCVDVATDWSNCGMCAHPCFTGARCQAGSCVTICAAPAIACNGQCVDPMNDPANCGACRHSCGTDGLCVSGTCTQLCAPGTLYCSGACVLSATDPLHCGSCTRRCGAGQTCVRGACSPPCTTGLISCGTSCIDPMTDAMNCGECGLACLRDQTCAGGHCTCGTGRIDCDSACVDTNSDSLNCGACGRACATGATCVAGVCPLAPTSWRFEAHDVRHTGSSPFETGHPPLTPAWIASTGFRALSHPVIDDGRVYVTNLEYVGPYLLVAYDLATGVERWRHDFGRGMLGHPAVAGGRVFVAQPSEWIFNAINASTGAMAWMTPFTGSSPGEAAAPIVAAGVVYSDGHYDLLARNVADGTEVVPSSGVSGSRLGDSRRSPALWGTRVYTFSAGILYANEQRSFRRTPVVTLPSATPRLTAPSFDDTRAYVISAPNLYAIDPTARRVVWISNGRFVGTAAVAGGVVYAIDGGVLVAFDPATGARRWSFTGDGALAFSPAIAAGHVYVSSATNVYAVDVTTHAMAWTAPVGGALAIAAGRLFLSGADGTLRAYTMTP